MAIVTELVTKFAFQGNIKPLDKFNASLTESIKIMSKGALAIAGLGTAFGVALNSMNKSTAMWVNQAKAVGITIEDFQALSSVSSQLGLDQQVGIDLLEEMNNKIGESIGLYKTNDMKPIGAVAEAFEILGLSFENIMKLSPADQFDTISNAINEMQDTQQASSAADILFGGEANKFFSLMKQQGKSFKQLKDDYKDINLLTKEGADGAVAYAKASHKASTVISTGFKEIAGIVGHALAPELEQLSKDFAIWFKLNKDFIVNVATKILKFFQGFVKAVYNSRYAIAGLTVVLIALKIALTGIRNVMAQILSPFLIIIAIFIAIVLVVDDLVTAFQGGKSVIADFVKEMTGIDIVPILKAMAEAFKVFFGFVGNMLTALWEGFKGFFGFLVDVGKKIKDVVGGAIEYLGIGNKKGEYFDPYGIKDTPSFGSTVKNQNTTSNKSVVQNNDIKITVDKDSTATAVKGSLDTQLRNAEVSAQGG